MSSRSAVWNLQTRRFVPDSEYALTLPLRAQSKTVLGSTLRYAAASPAVSQTSLNCIFDSQFRGLWFRLRLLSGLTFEFRNRVNLSSDVLLQLLTFVFGELFGL
jgi:hypothetical protein